MAMLKTVEKFAAGGAAAGAATAAYRSKGAANEEFDIDALVAEIESEIEEGKKKKDEETVDESCAGECQYKVKEEVVDKKRI